MAATAEGCGNKFKPIYMIQNVKQRIKLCFYRFLLKVDGNGHGVLLEGDRVTGELEFH